MSVSFKDEKAFYSWEFKNKNYPHFDAPCPEKRTKDIISKIKSTGKLSHPFYPLIKFQHTKISRDELGKKQISKRHIMHTARIDANIFAYYRTMLMNAYEELLPKLGLTECVIAYRSIPNSPHSEKGKCNIHFAHEAINEIKKQTLLSKECTAITMDISGFFDNLDHRLIKTQWCRVMHFTKGLPDDHFSVYKNITRYRHINRKTIEKKLNVKFSELRKAKKRQICSPAIFKEKILPDLSKENEEGIPQGTPISDVIANIYMLDFDQVMNKFAKKYNSYYRRYSDDILFVSNTNNPQKIIKTTKKLLTHLCKNLTIKDKKTIVSVFKEENQKIECNTFGYKNGDLEKVDKPFEYLGFSYNGMEIQIKTPTISRFYKKLCWHIKDSAKKAFKNIQKPIEDITCDDIYNAIRFDILYEKFLPRKDTKNRSDSNLNFYSYLNQTVKIIDDYRLRIFAKKFSKNKKKWINQYAKRYCKKIVKDSVKSAIP